MKSKNKSYFLPLIHLSDSLPFLSKSNTIEPYTNAPILGEPYASIADLQFTRVVGGNLIKVLAWYDNESGYTRTLVEHVLKIGKY